MTTAGTDSSTQAEVPPGWSLDGRRGEPTQRALECAFGPQKGEQGIAVKQPHHSTILCITGDTLGELNVFSCCVPGNASSPARRVGGRRVRTAPHAAMAPLHFW